MAGGGACVTQAAMKNMFRDMARFRRDRQAYIKAQRTLQRATYKAKTAQRNTFFEVDQAEFDCYFVCSGCGYFTEKQDSPCPGCGSSDWFDTKIDAVAENLRDEEQARRKVIPKAVSLLFIPISTVAVALTAAALIALLIAATRTNPDIDDAFLFELFIIFLMVTIGSGIAAFAFGRRHAAKLYFKWFPSKLPIRWHMPVLPEHHAKENRQVSGPATGSKTVRAPFSGKECLAYKVGVMFDVHGDARPPEWVLAEMRSTDFALGGLPLSGEKLVLESPLEPISDDEIEASGIELKRFLRERGLFLSEGDFWFYEARIEQGASATAHFYGGSDIVTITGAPTP